MTTVYRINFSDGSFYIGITDRPLHRRIDEHLHGKLGKSPCRAHVKRGHSCVKVERLKEYEDRKEALQEESRLIKKFENSHPEKLLNGCYRDESLSSGNGYPHPPPPSDLASKDRPWLLFHLRRKLNASVFALDEAAQVWQWAQSASVDQLYAAAQKAERRIGQGGCHG